MLIDNDAMIALQPAVLNSNLIIAIKASYTIACLASQSDIQDEVINSGALKVIEEVLQMITPGTLETSYVWERGDVICMVKLLTPDTLPSLQLACLHILASSMHNDVNRQFVRNCAEIVGCIRSCAASTNAFVYMVCTNILSVLELPIPSYMGSKITKNQKSEKLSSDLTAWSIDDVCRWVGNKCFKMYRQCFRDAFVSGAMLICLTDDHLKHMKVDNPMHRMAILFSITELKKVLQDDVSDNKGVVLAEEAEASPNYDIFISYRRQGGGDFAHLLKLSLVGMGFNVFLDVDNLGAGTFDKKILQYMTGSKHILVVWTKGCMDRFLDGMDYTQDFVAKEYLFAMEKHLSIVPVYKEDFEFPEKSRVPEVLRPILLVNAVKFVSEYRQASMEELKKRLVL